MKRIYYRIKIGGKFHGFNLLFAKAGGAETEKCCSDSVKTYFRFEILRVYHVVVFELILCESAGLFTNDARK